MLYLSEVRLLSAHFDLQFSRAGFWRLGPCGWGGGGGLRITPESLSMPTEQCINVKFAHLVMSLRYNALNTKS